VKATNVNGEAIRQCYIKIQRKLYTILVVIIVFSFCAVFNKYNVLAHKTILLDSHHEESLGKIYQLENAENIDSQIADDGLPVATLIPFIAALQALKCF
jgi:phage-related holin